MKRSFQALISGLLILRLVAPASACAEQFARLGGAKTAYFKVDSPVEDVSKQIHKLQDAFDIAVLPNRLLAAPQVRSALWDSNARLILNDYGNVEAVRGFLTHHLGGVKVIAVLPTSDDGIKNVFGDLGQGVAPTARYLRRVQEVARPLGADATVLDDSQPGDPKMSERLMSLIEKAKPDEFIGLVAHSHDGIIPLPDGSSLKVEDVQAALAGHQARGGVFTCNSIVAVPQGNVAVLTTKRLHFDEVMQVLVDFEAKDFYKKRTKGCVDVGTFVAALNNRLNEPRGPEKRVKVAMAGVGGSLIMFLLVQLTRSECQCGKCDCDKDNANAANNAARKERACDQPCAAPKQ